MTPVRIGFLVDRHVPAWQARVIEEVAREPGLEWSLLVRATPPARPGPPLLFRVYDWIDRFCHHGRGPSLAESGRFVPPPGIPLLELAANRATAPAERRAPAGAARLDVLVVLGSAPWPVGAEIATREVWALRWESGAGVESTGWGFPEMVRASPVTTATLERHAPDDRAVVIDRCVTATHPYSLQTGREMAVAGAAPMVLRGLRLSRDGRLDRSAGASASSAVPEGRTPIGTGSGPGPLASAPPTVRGARLIPALARLAFRMVDRLIEKAMWDEFHWSIAVAPRRAGEPAGEAPLGTAFRRLRPPRDRFYADPFLLDHGGEQFLFLEEFEYASGRGVIVAARLDGEGRPGPLQPALRRPYHLSFPQVFEWRGEVFMIPDTFEIRAVELYRSVGLPDRWERDRVLIEGVPAVDPTVIEHDGRLWMFLCMAPPGLRPDTEMHLYWADDIRGPWHAHPLNPVLRDVRRARAAGRPWRQDGHWFRPAQDCSIRYGYGLSFHRILTLTTDDYAEEAIATVAPERLAWIRRARGTHTWNGSSRFWVTDACVSEFRGRRWIARVLGRHAPPHPR